MKTAAQSGLDSNYRHYTSTIGAKKKREKEMCVLLSLSLSPKGGGSIFIIHYLRWIARKKSKKSEIFSHLETNCHKYL